MTQHRWVESGDVRLSADEDGSGLGVPALLVHADLGNRRQWANVTRHVAKSRRTVSFDRRGHGESARPEAFGYSRETGDIAAVADAFDLRRFILIGHSGGGAVSYLFAQAHPERVAGLLLIDPAQSGLALPDDQKAEMLERTRVDPKASAKSFYKAIAGDHPQVVERIMVDVDHTSDSTIVGMMSALGEFDPASVPRRFDGPTQVILQSRNDTRFGIRQIAGYPGQTLDGAGHWISLAAKERLLPLLDAFLKTVDEKEKAPAA